MDIFIRTKLIEICNLFMKKTNTAGFSIHGIIPGGGSTLKILDIRRLGLFFGVQHFEFKYFRGFFRKMSIFGVLRFCGYFWGSHKIGLYLEVISMHFRVVS